jgi:hypothetical protein
MERPSPAKIIIDERFSYQESWASAMAYVFATTRLLSAFYPSTDWSWKRKNNSGKALRAGSMYKKQQKINPRATPGSTNQLEQFPRTPVN